MAAHSETLAEIKSLDDLRAQQLDQLVEFFTQYNKLNGKHFRPLGNCDAKKAAAIVEKGAKKFKKSK